MILERIAEGCAVFVIGHWANITGNYVYEVSRVWLDYRFLDESSPGYKFKNGLLAGKELLERFKKQPDEIPNE